LLADTKKTETDRFWELEEEARKIARALRDCLDGHSRSKMRYFMHLMRYAGILKREDLTEFSEQLQEQIFGEHFKQRG
jgi:hypothetical protein